MSLSTTIISLSVTTTLVFFQIGNIIAHDESVRNLTIQQLKETLKTDDSIIDKMRYHFQSVKGSSQFFYIERKKARALNRHLIARSGGKEQMTLFMTLSPSDYHWNDFHQLLPEAKEYLNKTVVANVSDIPVGQEEHYITKHDDFKKRSAALNKYSDLFLNYFCTRVKVFFDTVLKEALGVEDFFYRVEFQSRGK